MKINKVTGFFFYNKKTGKSIYLYSFKIDLVYDVSVTFRVPHKNIFAILDVHTRIFT